MSATKFNWKWTWEISFKQRTTLLIENSFRQKNPNITKKVMSNAVFFCQKETQTPMLVAPELRSWVSISTSPNASWLSIDWLHLIKILILEPKERETSFSPTKKHKNQILLSKKVSKNICEICPPSVGFSCTWSSSVHLDDRTAESRKVVKNSRLN